MTSRTPNAVLSCAGAASFLADFGPEGGVAEEPQGGDASIVFAGASATFLIRMDLLESHSRIDFSPTV